MVRLGILIIKDVTIYTIKYEKNILHAKEKPTAYIFVRPIFINLNMNIHLEPINVFSIKVQILCSDH